jgi:hypothetical protein
VGGKGSEGNLISGILIVDGLAGKVKGLIPPLARGISGAIIVCCLNAFSATIGALNIREGILLMLLGLFSARSL